MRTSCRYHWLGSSLFFVSFSTPSVIRRLLSACKKLLCEKYSAPPGRRSDDGGLDDLEPLALHVNDRPAANRQREHRGGVAEVHVGDYRESVPGRALQDDLAQLLALIRLVEHRAAEEQAPDALEDAHVLVVHEDTVHPLGLGLLLGGLEKEDRAREIGPVRRAAQVLHGLEATADEHTFAPHSLQPRPAARSLPPTRAGEVLLLAPV